MPEIISNLLINGFIGSAFRTQHHSIFLPGCLLSVTPSVPYALSGLCPHKCTYRYPPPFSLSPGFNRVHTRDRCLATASAVYTEYHSENLMNSNRLHVSVMQVSSEASHCHSHHAGRTLTSFCPFGRCLKIASSGAWALAIPARKTPYGNSTSR